MTSRRAPCNCPSSLERFLVIRPSPRPHEPAKDQGHKNEWTAICTKMRAETSTMAETVDLETTCPNNHNQTISLSRDEFENKLTADSLVFHCNTCDTNWTPTKEEIRKLRSAFGEG